MAVFSKKNLKKHGLKLEKTKGTSLYKHKPEVSLKGSAKGGYYLVFKDPCATVKYPLTGEELLAIRDLLNKKFGEKGVKIA